MYQIIRKQNGEAFARAIREFDSGIFDIPGLDDIVKYAGKEAEPILTFLESLKDIQIKEAEQILNPLELLEQAGYDAFVADTLEKQNSIQPYYAPGEALCTFRDPTRFERYYIIHAVKKNVHEIQRSKTPSREDEYGTSVISIQILKAGGFISIKNRYNHTVKNPDNTFGSNPDNIIAGLSDALRKFFQVDFASQDVQLPEGFTFQAGRLFKYHCESQNVYFGKGFYLKNAQLFLLDPGMQEVIEDFIIDLKEKKFFSPIFYYKRIKKVLEVEMKDRKWQVRKNKQGEKEFYADDKLIFKTKEERLTYVHLPHTSFLQPNMIADLPFLREVSAPEVSEIADRNFLVCPQLEKIHLPKLCTIHRNCFNYLDGLKELSLPCLTYIGNDCFSYLKALSELTAPELIEVASFVLIKCGKLKKLYLPKLKEVRANFLISCPSLQEVEFPSLEATKDRFCSDNKKLKKIFCPLLRKTENDSFALLPKLQKIELLRLEELGRYSFYNATELSYVNLPNMVFMGGNCFMGTPQLTTFISTNFNTKLAALSHHPNYDKFNLSEPVNIALQPPFKPKERKAQKY